MARKDNQVEFEVPEDEVVEETPQPSRPLFKKKESIEQPVEPQTVVITENQLIIELLKGITVKLDEVLNIAKQ
jgi:hypothetical protein